MIPKSTYVRISLAWVMGILLLITAPMLVSAQEYRGVAVSTEYPSIMTAERELIIFDLTVTNYDIAPQRVDLALTQVPQGWEHTFVGGGGLVDAVFASPDKEAAAQLWLDPPDDAPPARYEFDVRASGSFGSFTLPLTVTIGERLPQRLDLSPEVPALSGSPSADFTFRAAINNRSTQESVVSLSAEAPPGFQVTFSKRYQNQEISAVPMEAGEEEEVEISVEPPDNVTAGEYPVRVIADTETARATTELTVTIKGQPELSLTGPGGRVSDTAVAGRETLVELTLENEGEEAARNVTLRGSAPRNWELRFDPEEIDSIPAGESVTVNAYVTPSSEAITGDYNVTMRARGDDANTSERFRITVRTSALWGVVAVLIIAIALLVVVLAVRRYGRR